MPVGLLCPMSQENCLKFKLVKTENPSKLNKTIVVQQLHANKQKRQVAQEWPSNVITTLLCSPKGPNKGSKTINPNFLWILMDRPVYQIYHD